MGSVVGTDVFRFAPCAGPCCEKCVTLMECMPGLETPPASVDVTLPTDFSNLGGPNDCTACNELSGGIFTCAFTGVVSSTAFYLYRNYSFCTHRFLGVDLNVGFNLSVIIKCATSPPGCEVRVWPGLFSPSLLVATYSHTWRYHLFGAGGATSYLVPPVNEIITGGAGPICNAGFTEDALLEL